MSCPFFGRIALPVSRTLDERGSINCALAIGTYMSPCKMHGKGEEPSWAACDENTGSPWKNDMLTWIHNTEGQKKLAGFRYPD